MASSSVLKDNEMENEMENDHSNDGHDGNEDEHGTHQLVEGAVAMIPDKVEDCDKSTFFVYLLLVVEIQNMRQKDKIDFLLLLNFLTTDEAFNLTPPLFGGQFLFKLSEESFLQSFFEKTDFDTDRLSKIYSVLKSNDTTETVKTFQHHIEAMDVDQIWAKINKISAELESSKSKRAAKSEENAKDEKGGMDSKEDDIASDDDDDDDDSSLDSGMRDMYDGKIQKIRYKIRDFDKLVEFVGNEYNAPSGHNRTGIGARKYAAAQKNGPGGNLTKFIAWDKAKAYGRFHHSHYDWWMFPNDRDSWGQGRKYALFQKDIDALLNEVDGYAECYKLGTRLVLRSWGWDMDEERFYGKDERTAEQRWTGYNVRLLKMLYSTIILKQWDVYRSVYKFCIGLLERGEVFQSEPMMYDYLGLEKPQSSRRRYHW